MERAHGLKMRLVRLRAHSNTGGRKLLSDEAHEWRSFRNCFAHAAGHVVAPRKGRARSSGRAFRHTKSLISQVALLDPLQPGWYFSAVQDLVAWQCTSTASTLGEYCTNPRTSGNASSTTSWLCQAPNQPLKCKPQKSWNMQIFDPLIFLDLTLLFWHTEHTHTHVRGRDEQGQRPHTHSAHHKHFAHTHTHTHSPRAQNARSAAHTRPRATRRKLNTHALHITMHHSTVHTHTSFLPTSVTFLMKHVGFPIGSGEEDGRQQARRLSSPDSWRGSEQKDQNRASMRRDWHG